MSAFRCPHCSRDMATLPALAGEVVNCPHCGGQLTMPGEPLPAAEGTRTLPYHVAASPEAPLPPVATLPTVKWEGPLDALALAVKLLREGRLPSEPGVTVHLRIVIGGSGDRIQALRVPMTSEAVVKIDWR